MFNSALVGETSKSFLYKIAPISLEPSALSCVSSKITSYTNAKETIFLLSFGFVDKLLFDCGELFRSHLRVIVVFNPTKTKMR